MNLEDSIKILKNRIKDRRINEELGEELTLLACRAREESVEYVNEHERIALIKLSKTGILTDYVLEKTVRYVERYNRKELEDLINPYL